MVVAHVVPIAVAIGVCPLGSIGWECIDDTIALVGGVVSIVVFINVSVPVVNALVVPPMSAHDVRAFWAPRGPVIDSTTIGSDTGTWRFKLVDTNSQSVLVNVMLPAMDV